MMSFNRHLATSQDFSVLVGKAYIYPEKVQTPTDICILELVAFQ
jgi:hypothetical protein